MHATTYTASAPTPTRLQLLERALIQRDRAARRWRNDPTGNNAESLDFWIGQVTDLIAVGSWG